MHGICSSTLEDATNDTVSIVTADSIEHVEGVGLSLGGLLLIALLKGGDYDMKGVAGCGIAIACSLARCGFGDILLEAFQTMDLEPFKIFLASWRNTLRNELQTNSRGLLPYSQTYFLRWRCYNPMCSLGRRGFPLAQGQNHHLGSPKMSVFLKLPRFASNSWDGMTLSARTSSVDIFGLVLSYGCWPR